MINYENPKHIKTLGFIIAIFSIPLGIYSIYLSIFGIIDGSIYISTRSHSGVIVFNESPKRYLFFICLLGFGGLLAIWAGMVSFFGTRKLGKKDSKPPE